MSPMRKRYCSYPGCHNRAIYLAVAPPPDRTMRQACIRHAITYRDVSKSLIVRLDGKEMIDGEPDGPLPPHTPGEVRCPL